MPEDFIRVYDDPLWALRSVRRSGAYAASELLTDEDLHEAVAGRYGGAQVRRQGTAAPGIRSRWESERESILQALAANDDWSVLMNQWLDEAEADPSCVDVDVYVYNPCDLLQTLVYGVADTSSPFEKYAPMLRATVTYTGGRTRTTLGHLWCPAVGFMRGLELELHYPPLTGIGIAFDHTLAFRKIKCFT